MENQEHKEDKKNFTGVLDLRNLPETKRENSGSREKSFHVKRLNKSHPGRFIMPTEKKTERPLHVSDGQPRNRGNAWINFLLPLLAFLIPVIALNSAEVNHEVLRSAGVIAAAGLFILITSFGVLQKKKVVVLRSTILLSFLFFALISTLSVIFSADPWSGVWGPYGNTGESLGVVVGFFFFLLLASGTIYARWQLREKILIALLGAASLLTWSALMAAWRVQTLGVFADGVGLWGNDAASLAIFLIVVWLAALSAITESSLVRWGKYWLGAYSVLMFLVLLIADWSWAWALLAIGSVVVLWLGSKQFSSFRSRTLVLKSLIVFSLLMFLTGVDTGKLAKGQVAFKESFVSSSIRQGLAIPQFIVEREGEAEMHQTGPVVLQGSLQDKPLLGHGVGNYYQAFSKYRPQAFNQSPQWYVRWLGAPTEFFEKVVSIGVVGTLAYLAIWFFALLTLFRATRRNPHYSGILAAMLVLTVAQWVYAFPVALKWLWLMLLLITLEISVPSAINAKEQFFRLCDEGKPNRFALLGVLGAAVGLMFLIAGISLGWSNFNYNRFKNISQLSAASDSAIAQVVKLNPFNPWYKMLTSRLYLERLNSWQAGGITQNPKPEEVKHYADLAIASAKQASQTSPQNVFFWENYANVYATLQNWGMEGADRFAEDAWNEAIKLDPGNPQLFMRRARTKYVSILNQSDKDKEEKLKAVAVDIQKALELKPDYVEAKLLRAEVALAQQDKETAHRWLTEIKTQPQLPLDVAVQIAKLYYNLDDKDNAKEILNAVVAVNDRVADAHYILGIIYSDEGDRIKAQSEFEKVLELNPDSLEALKKLDGLKNAASSHSESGVDESRQR